tara:strand:+ start:1276 stop:1860 length:585 start_codon:yes stop_codon:yes gene_type:complete
MFGFGVSVGVHDQRVQSYLKNELDPPITQFDGYERQVDGDGFVQYKFPGMSEEEFRSISEFLNGTDGVTLIGVDTQLTERKIMKLADLIKEWDESPSTSKEERPKLYPPDENGFVDLISALEKTLGAWKDRYVGGYYTDDQNRADDYTLDIQEIIEMYKEKMPKASSSGEMGDYESKELQEQKVRKLIRKTLRK